jgi:SEC-C motif-containing protein
MRTACPCGRSGTFGGVLPYEHCCGRFLDDPATPAPDAPSLMRSRYTAYVRGRADYLLTTWDAGTRPHDLRLDHRITWQGLELRDERALGDDRAQVEFVARYHDASGRPGVLHELSRFIRRDGRWYYLDGDVH